MESPLFSLVGGDSNTILGLDFSADGSRLAVAGGDGTVAVWGMDEGRLLYTLAGHAGAVNDVAFSPEMQTLATVSVDGPARIWDASLVADGETTHYATERNLRDLEPSPAGEALAAVITAMSQLGFGTVFGLKSGALQQPGLYRLSRNPQIVAYGLVLAGFALMWPSWVALGWVLVYLPVAHMMVLAEAEHLRRAHEKAYEEYCRRVPRYRPLRLKGTRLLLLILP